MINLTFRETALIWEELAMAREGMNGYGGDTAEIYAHRLMPNRPGREVMDKYDGGLTSKADRVEAANSLAGMCELFSDTHGCEVLIDGMKPADWKKVVDFGHRAKVKVV